MISTLVDDGVHERIILPEFPYLTDENGGMLLGTLDNCATAFLSPIGSCNLLWGTLIHSSRKRRTVYRSLNRNRRTESGFGDEIGYGRIQLPVRVSRKSIQHPIQRSCVVVSRFSSSDKHGKAHGSLIVLGN
jgi:hypothetical protein